VEFYSTVNQDLVHCLGFGKQHDFGNEIPSYFASNGISSLWQTFSQLCFRWNVHASSEGQYQQEDGG